MNIVIKTTTGTMARDARSYWEVWQMVNRGDVLPESPDHSPNPEMDMPEVLVDPPDNSGRSSTYHPRTLGQSE